MVLTIITVMNSTVIDGGGSLGIPAVAIPVIVKELYTTNYNIAASSTLLFYDCLLTLDREVKYIWKSGFSFVVVLFSVIRLLAVGGQIFFFASNFGTSSVSESYCRGDLWFQGILGLVMFTGVDILLIFRVYALYGRNKMLFWSLCILEFIVFVAVMSLFAVALPKFRIVPNTFPRQLRVGVCIPLGYPILQPDLWLPFVPMQGIILFLVAGRYIYLQLRGPMLLNTTSHLYYTFIRDGAWTFFVLFVNILLCVVGDNLELVLGPIALQWCYPVIGICTSRLILNLRAANKKPQDSLLGASLASTKMAFVGERANANTKESSSCEYV